MKTSHISLDRMTLIGEGRVFNLYGMETKVGYREMVLRRDGNYEAAKMLMLCVDPDVELVRPAEGSNLSPLEALAYTVHTTGPELFNVFLLATDRPINYVPTMPFVGTHQLELCGGVLEFGDQTNLAGAVREAMQEAGIARKNQIIMTASLVDPACPFDSGTHGETYALQVCVVRGRPKPPRREGSYPDKSQLIPFPYALDYLKRLRQQHYCVEGYAILSLMALQMMIYEHMLKVDSRPRHMILSGLP